MLSRLIFILLSCVALLGCESLPKATYTTTTGCGIAQWTQEFVQANVTSMTWSGPCVSGLAHGDGNLVVAMTNNRQRLYSGKMDKGFIHGDGAYTRESGWKYQGHFLWITFTGGKIYDASNRLIFDGLMLHNEKFEGKNLVFNDQRFGSGKLYWHDSLGTMVDDGNFTGSAGPGIGFLSINVATGAGLNFGKVIQNGKIVARWVQGRNYADDVAYMQAQTKYFEASIATMNKDNEAYLAQQRIKDAEDRRQAMAALSGALGAATGGQTANERLRLATESLNQSAYGATPPAASAISNNPASNASSDYVLIKDAPHCAQYYLISDQPETRTTLRKISFGMRNSCNFPVYIIWHAKRDGQELGISWPVSALPKTGPSNNTYYPSFAKMEVPAFGFTGRQFLVNIDSVCPTPEAASQVLGKPVREVLRSKEKGYCQASLVTPQIRVGTSQ